MIQVQHIATLSGHQNPIYTIECSQKPGILFSAGNDRGVVEWSLVDQSFIKIMFPVRSSVYALHAPASAPILIAGERSGQITIFDFKQQKITASLHQHKLPIFDIKSVSSRNELVVCSEDGTVSVWSLNQDGRETNVYPLLYHFKVSADSIRAMAIDSTENKIAFGGKDKLIRIYSLSDYRLLHVLDGHTLPVSSLQFSPDGKYLLSGGRDATLRMWDMVDFSLKKSVNAHLFALYGIAFHPDKPYFATASRDKSIKIWDAHLNLKKIISVEKGYESHRLSINKICWDPAASNLISAGDDKLVMIWEVKIND